METINIKGEKIQLRDWLLQDVEPFRDWQRPGMQWKNMDGPYYRSTADEAEKIVNELRIRIERTEFPDPRMRLVIADRSTNNLIGLRRKQSRVSF